MHHKLKRIVQKNMFLHFISALLSIILIRVLIQQSGCKYESEVRAYLQKEDVVGCDKDGTLAKPTCEKNPRQKNSKPRLAAREVCHSVSKKNLDKKDRAGPSSWTSLKDKFESDCDATREALSVFQYNSDNLATDDDADNAMQTDVHEHSETKLSRKEEQLHRSPSPDHTKGLKTNPDTSLGSPEDLFYLPKWEVRRKINFSRSAGNLEIILANVQRLLSRSPPECLDLHFSLSLKEPVHVDESDEVCCSPREEDDHFQVNFNLGNDENSLDSDILDCNVAGAPPECVILPSETVSAGPDSSANSPSWDEVFDDVVDDGADKNADLPLQSKVQLTSLDESIDLFGDDEAFLQISLPSIQTPKKDTVIPITRQDTDQRKQVTQNVEDASNIFHEESSMSPVLVGHKPPSEQRSETFNYSQDIFSVNFDLGFSFDSEEEQTAEPVSDMTAEPKVDSDQMHISLTLNKPNASTDNFALGHVSTPRVYPGDKKPPSLIAKSNLSPIITKRESLVRPNASTPTPGFASPKSRTLELFPKVLRSQAQPRWTGNRLCRRSLLDAAKPVYEDHACSGQFNIF